MASANKALSILVLNPRESVSKAFSSSFEKIPIRRPVPIKVPIVSKVSDKLKARIVIKTCGSLAEFEKSDPIPSAPKAAPKVVPSAWNELPNELACQSIAPN